MASYCYNLGITIHSFFRALAHHSHSPFALTAGLVEDHRDITWDARSKQATIDKFIRCVVDSSALLANFPLFSPGFSCEAGPLEAEETPGPTVTCCTVHRAGSTSVSN